MTRLGLRANRYAKYAVNAPLMTKMAGDESDILHIVNSAALED